MAEELVVQLQPDQNIRQEAQLIALVLDGVTSDHSRRSYRTGLAAFFAWVRASGSVPAFSTVAIPVGQLHRIVVSASPAI